MTYTIESHDIDGQTFSPGDRVILTEWLDGPDSESHVLTGTFAGRLDATLGTMIVVTDDETAEDVVLAASDLVAIDRFEICNQCPDLRALHNRDDGDTRAACSVCECDDYEEEA